MSERFFDNLARTLASPMPRRRALRVAGVALVAAAVPGFRPPAALADCGPDTLCSSLCHSSPIYTGACGVQTKSGCGSQVNCRMSGGCMVAGQKCCRGGSGASEDAWICPSNLPCGKIDGPRCPCPTTCTDGTCCPRSKGRCVNGRCCPAIRTTFRPGSSKKAVACCPPGTVAVPGGVGLCCPKSKPNCCDAYDTRVDTGEQGTLGVNKGKLCVNGKQRNG